MHKQVFSHTENVCITTQNQMIIQGFNPDAFLLQQNVLQCIFLNWYIQMGNIGHKKSVQLSVQRCYSIFNKIISVIQWNSAQKSG